MINCFSFISFLFFLFFFLSLRLLQAISTFSMIHSTLLQYSIVVSVSFFSLFFRFYLDGLKFNYDTHKMFMISNVILRFAVILKIHSNSKNGKKNTQRNTVQLLKVLNGLACFVLFYLRILGLVEWNHIEQEPFTFTRLWSYHLPVPDNLDKFSDFVGTWKDTSAPIHLGDMRINFANENTNIRPFIPFLKSQRKLFPFPSTSIN